MDAPEKYLILTRHDYRTRIKANMHFIAGELAKRGKTRMFSFAFSWLSLIKKDPRSALWKRCNRVQTEGGVECYLWRSPLHAVSLRHALLYPLEKLLFTLYLCLAPKRLHDWIKDSSTIIVESSFPVILVRLCHRVNPKARLIYLASDSLSTISCARTIIDEFSRIGSLFDHIVVPSALLIPEMPQGVPVRVIPHGLDTSIAERKAPSPYEGGVNIVSVGSMLFDETFFAIAAEAFPDINFHVIGGGAKADTLYAHNIIVYNEMPFEKTIPYLQYAQAGVAPYNGDKVAPFLADTSMKLMQYGFLGLPAICPVTVVGEHKGRFGYTPGDKASIIAAIRAALRQGRFEGTHALSWAEVTQEIIK